MFQETCSLVLKHSDISTDITLATVYNSIGSWSNGKQTTTWRVNLKKVLGPAMYDNNDMFVLRLNQICEFHIQPKDGWECQIRTHMQYFKPVPHTIKRTT